MTRGRKPSFILLEIIMEKRLEEIDYCCNLFELLKMLSKESLIKTKEFVEYLISKQENNE